MATVKTTTKKDGTATNGALTIVDEYEIGEVELSTTKDISVSLIRTAAKHNYIAIWRKNRSSQKSAWKSESKLWTRI